MNVLLIICMHCIYFITNKIYIYIYKTGTFICRNHMWNNKVLGDLYILNAHSFILSHYFSVKVTPSSDIR